ncbi:hypothetical protein D3C73_831600 [compost metagenome]
MMSLRRAPTAIRTPISRVRSVTDTSMMFMTPMPPTISEINAISDTSSVIVAVVRSMVLRMASVLNTKKSFTTWRRINTRSMAFSAAAGGVASLTRTVMLLRCCCPSTRDNAVV